MCAPGTVTRSVFVVDVDCSYIVGKIVRNRTGHVINQNANRIPSNLLKSHPKE